MTPRRWVHPPGWSPLPPAYWAYGWELRQLDWLRRHGLWRPQEQRQEVQQ